MTFGAYAPMPLRLGGSVAEGMSASQHARLCADLVAVKRVMPLAAWTFFQQDTPPYSTAITSYFGMNGSGLLYAPTLSVNDLGDVDFQWSSAFFEDEYGQQHPRKLRAFMGTSASTGLGYSGNAAVVIISEIVRGVNVRWGTNTIYAAGTVSVRVW